MKKSGLFSGVYVLFFLVLLYTPIVIMIVYSFNSSELDVGWNGFSFKWYKELLSQRDAARAFQNSIIISTTSTLISVLLGAFGAVGFHKFQFRFKSMLDSFFYVPTIVPAMLLGVSMLALYNILGIPLSKVTIIIAHVTFCTPVTFNTIRVSLKGFDKSIEEAAVDLGCNEFQTITKVIIPNITPAMLSGGLLAFTFSLEDVLTTFFVAGPKDETLSMFIFGQMKTGMKPTLNALSTLMIILTVSIGIIMQILENRSAVK